MEFFWGDFHGFYPEILLGFSCIKWGLMGFGGVSHVISLGFFIGLFNGISHGILVGRYDGDLVPAHSLPMFAMAIESIFC